MEMCPKLWWKCVWNSDFPAIAETSFFFLITLNFVGRLHQTNMNFGMGRTPNSANFSMGRTSHVSLAFSIFSHQFFDFLYVYQRVSCVSQNIPGSLHIFVLQMFFPLRCTAQVTQIFGGEAAPKHQMPLGTVHFSGEGGVRRRLGKSVEVERVFLTLPMKLVSWLLRTWWTIG